MVRLIPILLGIAAIFSGIHTSLKRPVFATVVIIAMLAVGALSYRGLPINENPKIDISIIGNALFEKNRSSHTKRILFLRREQRRILIVKL